MRLARIIAFLFLIFSWPARADENIRLAQIELRAAGLYQGSVDGIMGSRTSAAIRRYQLQQDLRITGELNLPTLQRLGITPRPGEIPSAPTELQIQLAELFSGGPYTTASTARQQSLLKQAQKKLIERGFWNGTPDGVPGAAFSTALKSWQRDASLKPTARMDSATCEKLRLKEVK